MKRNVLFFILPPVIGALIGLFTNWLAIKMLFRPLKAYRLLGLRLPFTPGILPRERSGIARSLGDTVAEDLLTPDAVEAKLSSPAFTASLEQALQRAGSSLAAMRVAGARAEERGAEAEGLGRELAAAAASIARSFAGSEPFKAGVGAGVSALLEKLDGVSLAELKGSAGARALGERFADPAFKDALATLMADAAFGCVGRALERGGGLSTFVPREAAENLARAMAKAAYPALGSAVSGVMDDPTIRSSMERLGAKLVRKTMDRLSAVQRFFIGLGQYDKAIFESMPATIADFGEAIATMFADPKTKDALVERAAAAVGELWDRPLSSYKAFADPGAVEASRAALVLALRGALDRPAPPESLVEAALGGLDAGAVLAALPGLKESVAARAAEWLAGLLGSGEAARAEPSPAAAAVGGAAKAFAAALAERARGRTIGELVGLDQTLIDGLAHAAGAPLAALAARESGAILAGVDVRGLVVEKIDSLEMIEVERMLLRVIDRELKAVTWFGGVLGFLIGVGQSVLFLFR